MCKTLDSNSFKLCATVNTHTKNYKLLIMKIQFNTDKTIKGDEKIQDFFSTQIAEELDRFQSDISRIEIHLSDENGNKDGMNDILCLLEARIVGRNPIAVSNQADTTEQAVSGAIDKLKNSLETIFGRIQNY